MEDIVQNIDNLPVVISRVLERTARDALFLANKSIALMSTNMAEAIRVHARDDTENAEYGRQHVTAMMISKVRSVHPRRLVSYTTH